MKVFAVVVALLLTVSAGFAADPAGFRDPVSGIEFVFVKGGCYEMGNVFGDDKTRNVPAHAVCVDDFYIAKHEVTQGQWKALMGDNPSVWQAGDTYPIDSVNWQDTQSFLAKLNEKTKKQYRLPTEAEWEYAARSSGKKDPFAGFSNENEAYLYGNFCDEACGLEKWIDRRGNDGFKNTAPVGSYKPNSLGLYDMSGNLWEWVSDWYAQDYYSRSPKENPKGPESGELKVLRGGCWGLPIGAMKPSVRGWMGPDKSFNTFGFRVALSAK